MANIVVIASGSAPITVVREAKKLRNRESRHGEKYDKVYCVFDRDEHPTFDKACDEARASDVKLARSWPCFELWLRLHFGFSRQPYARSGGKSAAQNCVDEVSGLLPEYAKAAPGISHKLENRLEQAKVDAARALADAEATGELDPSNEIHELVGCLQLLKLDGAAPGG